MPSGKRSPCLDAGHSSSKDRFGHFTVKCGDLSLPHDSKTQKSAHGGICEIDPSDTHGCARDQSQSAFYGPDGLVGGGVGTGVGFGVETGGGADGVGVGGFGVALLPPDPAPLPCVPLGVGCGVVGTMVPAVRTIAPGGGVCPGFR